jgi:hypothetical protein
MQKLLMGLVLLCLGGCEPALNWRDVRLAQGGLLALMPCKPDVVSRKVPFVQGSLVDMTVASCDAAGVTFALTVTQVSDPSQAARSLGQWREVVQKHLQMATPRTVRFVPSHALPLAESVRVSGAGRSPQGAALAVEAAFFAQGVHVFQATLIGQTPQAPGAEVTDTFFAGLRLP